MNSKRIKIILEVWAYVIVIAAGSFFLWYSITKWEPVKVITAELKAEQAEMKIRMERIEDQVAEFLLNINNLFSMQGQEFTGLASWYARPFTGRFTASGEVFDPNALSAAHRSLAFGTVVRVENQNNGQVVIVKINDRGPFVNDRIIDLSPEGAARLGTLRRGLTPVTITIISRSGIKSLVSPKLSKAD